MDQEQKQARWAWVKPTLWGLVVGLIVGPAISGYFGWQVLSSTDHQNVQNAVYNQEAHTCALLARQHVPDTSKLDYTKRRNLAEKYAKLPWDTSDSYRVVDACSNALATKVTAKSTASANHS